MAVVVPHRNLALHKPHFVKEQKTCITMTTHLNSSCPPPILWLAHPTILQNNCQHIDVYIKHRTSHNPINLTSSLGEKEYNKLWQYCKPKSTANQSFEAAFQWRPVVLIGIPHRVIITFQCGSAAPLDTHPL